MCECVCVCVHMWVSYNLCVGHCYENLVGAGGFSRVYVRVHVWGLLKAFCQGAGCCHEWEALFWDCAKVSLSISLCVYEHIIILTGDGNTTPTIYNMQIKIQRCS